MSIKFDDNQKELHRGEILKFLQWNDKNGVFTDEMCNIEDMPHLTYEESVTFFLFVVWNDLFYKCGEYDNALDYEYDNILEISKTNNIYDIAITLIEELDSSNNKNKVYKKIIDLI